MPTKKELENLTWDMKDENTRAMILCYWDRILLENGFDWKVSFQRSWEKTAEIQNTVTVDNIGIMFHINRRSTYIPFPNRKFDYMSVTTTLIQLHQQALSSAGWCAESDGKKIIFKNI